MSEVASFLQQVSAGILDRQYRSEVAEEMLDHIECAAAALEEQGMDPREARSQAIRDFGDPAAIAHLLRHTGKGGTSTMFVRFAGFCAALGGTLMAGLMPQAGFLRGIQPMMNRLVPGDPDGSLLLALMATFWFLGLLGAWYRHAGAERERQLLLVAPVTGALLLVLSPWGGWYFWVAAVLLFSLGLSLSGWLTLRQLEQPFRSLGALAVAGGLVPLASIILHLRLDIGPGTWLTQLGGLGWISLGVALLLARATGSNPARPVV